jgi:hypothetical protein
MIEGVGAWTDKNGDEKALRKGLAARRFGANRRTVEPAETWLKLKDRGHVEATLAALNVAERSATAAEKAAKWTFRTVAAACGMAIILMQALIPQYDNGRQAFMEPSGNQARLDVSLTQTIHTDRVRRGASGAEPILPGLNQAVQRRRRTRTRRSASKRDGKSGVVMDETHR